MSSTPTVTHAEAERSSASRRPRPGWDVRVVHAIHAALERGTISPGDAAALRRLQPEDPSSPAFWRVFLGYVKPPEEPSVELQRRWAIILNAVAQLVGLNAAPIPLGRALRDARLSELRLIRLLRADSQRIADAVRHTARFLASKGQSVNLADLADLVLTTERRRGERVRRRIARHYYQPTVTEEG